MALTQSDKVGSFTPGFDLQTLSGRNDAASPGEFSLADAAEELSLHMAHKVESKVHTELKIRRDHAFTEIKIEAVLLYLEKTQKGDTQAALEELVSHLLSGQSDPKSAISRFTSNTTHQFLALNYALQRAKQENASQDLIDAIFDAYADLETRDGIGIRADLNTIDAATNYSSDIDRIEKFQTTYRDIVIGESSLSKTFSKALTFFGGKHILTGLQQLTQALGLDLSATKSSVGMDKIHAILTDIYQIQTIATTLESCTHIKDKLSEAVRSMFNPERLMIGIINLIDDKFVSANTILNLASEQGIQSTYDRITFFTATKLIIKDIPGKLFYDEQAISNAIESAQFALDHAIKDE